MKALLVIFGLLFSASLFASNHPDGKCGTEAGEECETPQVVFSGDTGEDCEEGKDCEKKPE